MNASLWKQKLQILDELNQDTDMLSENSFAIFFALETEEPLVYLKPLNESFDLKHSSNQKGILINYERELIEEDDQEYALDVMQLFNGSQTLSFKEAPETYTQLLKSLQLLRTEYESQQCSYIMLKTVLKVVLLHLIRFQQKHYAVQELDQKRVYEFLKLMETHYLQQTESAFYAENMGISDKRLNQILKQKLNRTAKQIIQQRQITEAKRLLIRSASTVKEIGFELGFNSLSSFSRFFKNSVGESPSKYRLAHLS